MYSSNSKKKHRRSLPRILTNAKQSITREVRERGYSIQFTESGRAEYEKKVWKPKVNLTIEETQQWAQLQSEDEGSRILIAEARQDLKFSTRDIEDHAIEFMTALNRSHRLNASSFLMTDCLLL
jgi:hypothetical protein